MRIQRRARVLMVPPSLSSGYPLLLIEYHRSITFSLGTRLSYGGERKIKIRGFPSLPHDRFGIVNEAIAQHISI